MALQKDIISKETRRCNVNKDHRIIKKEIENTGKIIRKKWLQESQEKNSKRN